MIGGRRPLVREILSQSVKALERNLKKAAITAKRYEIGCQLLLITNIEIAYGLSIGTNLDDLE